MIQLLTYLGALPFFLAIYISSLNTLFLGVDGSSWFLAYGLVILSFMAGTLWGQVVNEGVTFRRIGVASNIITLTAWLAFLLADSWIALIVIAVGFLALYTLELLVMNKIKRPVYYINLRLKVTALVLVAHGVMFWQI